MMNSSSSYPPPPLPLRQYIAQKAIDILTSHVDVTELTNLVTNLCYENQTNDSSKLLYKSFAKNFPNLLAFKLLQVYRSLEFTTSPRLKIRSFSLSLLDSLLVDIEDSRVGLKTKAVKDIQEALNACLISQETSDEDFKLLSRIVSHVAVHSFIQNLSWDELCSYIVSLGAGKKALLMFSELPMVLDQDFLMRLLKNGLKENIVNALMDANSDEEKWCLGLEAGFSVALQFIRFERKDLVFDMVYVILKSVLEMVNVRKRDIVVLKGLMRIVSKVHREAFRFRKAAYEFVSRFALTMMEVNGVTEVTKMAAKMIKDVLDKYYMGGGALDLGFIQNHTGIKFSA